MSARAEEELAQRRLVLQMQCAAQRVQLAEDGAELASHLQWVDHGLALVRRLRLSPIMVATGVALTLAVRASGALGTLSRALPVLMSLRRLWRSR